MNICAVLIVAITEAMEDCAKNIALYEHRPTSEYLKKLIDECLSPVQIDYSIKVILRIDVFIIEVTYDTGKIVIPIKLESSLANCSNINLN